MNAPHPLLRIWRWLRAGYPADEPHGHVALLALLPRTLTNADVQHVAAVLIEEALSTGQPIIPTQITGVIRRMALQEPTTDDATRVTSRLASRGWTVTTPPTAG